MNAKTVVIQCSLKSLAVALAVLGFLPESAGDQGLMAIPCIVGHLTELVIDSMVVSGWLAVRNQPVDRMENDLGVVEQNGRLPDQDNNILC